MRVIEASDSDAARWNAFVDGHEDGSFFHQFAWRDIYKRALGHRPYYLLAEDDHGICAVLPLVYVKSRLFGKTLSSLPFTSFAGALAISEHALTAIERTANDLGVRLGVGNIEYRLRRPSGRGRPAKDLYDLFLKPIEADEDANMKAIRSKQRNVIRKGIKNGLESSLGDVDSFYPVYAESVRNLGTPVFPKRLFTAIKNAFGDNVEIVNASLDERIVSSAMNFYYRNTVCPYYWGGIFEARRLNGNDFLAWELINRAATRGATLFDFGRSKKGTGSHRWKKNLGFEIEPLSYEYTLIKDRAVPDVNPLNPKYRMMVETWKRLPLPLANRLGPLVSKSLG